MNRLDRCRDELTKANNDVRRLADALRARYVVLFAHFGLPLEARRQLCADGFNASAGAQEFALRCAQSRLSAVEREFCAAESIVRAALA